MKVTKKKNSLRSKRRTKVKRKAKCIRRRRHVGGRLKHKRRFRRSTGVKARRARKRIRCVRLFRNKANPNSKRQAYMLDWLQSAQNYHSQRYNKPNKVNRPKTVRPSQSNKPNPTGLLSNWEYQKVVKKLCKKIHNENTALRIAEKENKLLKLELESARDQLQEMHLPLSVRRIRARSLERLSSETVYKLCTFLDDDSLFVCRTLCMGFYLGYFNQQISTARRAKKTNMKRIVRLAKLGCMFPNVSIVLVN